MTNESATEMPKWRLRQDLPGFQVLNADGRAVAEFWLGEDANTAIKAVNNHDRLTKIEEVAGEVVTAVQEGCSHAPAFAPDVENFDVLKRGTCHDLLMAANKLSALLNTEEQK